MLQRLPLLDDASGADSAPFEADGTDPDVMRDRREQAQRDAYVLCAAMTFHACADGLALGTEEEEDHKFAVVLLAVAVHKVLDGLAVGE